MRLYPLSMAIVILLCATSGLREAAAQGLDAGSVAFPTNVTSTSAALRQALAGATQDAPHFQVPSMFFISGSLLRLERESREGQTRLSCEVSLVAFDPNGGEMRAMLTGWAISTVPSPSSPSDARLQEKEVIKTAVARALFRLWQSLD